MMDSNLQRLQELQVLDSRVAGLERKLEAIPTRIHGIRDGLQQAKASIEAIRGKLDGARKDIDQVLASRRKLPSLNAPAKRLKAQPQPK